MQNKFVIKVGEKIKSLRKKKQISLSKLSQLSGVQIATLSRIENNKMTGTIKTHAQIAYALGIELFELYKDIKAVPITKYSGLG